MNRREFLAALGVAGAVASLEGPLAALAPVPVPAEGLAPGVIVELRDVLEVRLHRELLSDPLHEGLDWEVMRPLRYVDLEVIQAYSDEMKNLLRDLIFSSDGFLMHIDGFIMKMHMVSVQEVARSVGLGYDQHHSFNALDQGLHGLEWEARSYGSPINPGEQRHLPVLELRVPSQ